MRRPRYLALTAASLIILVGVMGAASTAGASRAEEIDPAVLATATGPDGVLNIAVREIKPFAFKTVRGWTGYSIEMWEEAATALNIPYEYQETSSVAEQLESVRTGNADAALGAISITATREAEFDFSVHMYDSGLQILTKPTNQSVWSVLARMFSKTILLLVLGIIVLLVIAGHIIWLVERHRNPEFQQGYLDGVWDGIWWAIVTMTTVGYGDKVVQTRAGRLVAMFWMLLGLVLVAQFTAIITSTLTVSSLESGVNEVGDLIGKRVVTVANTSSSEFAESLGLEVIEVPDADQGFDAVQSGRAAAFLFDSPILQHYVSVNDDDSLKVVGAVLQPQGYGMAFPDESPIIDYIDLEFLKQREDGFTAGLYEQYFG